MDNNATTPPLPEVLEYMSSCFLQNFGNASSTHAAGERARALIRTSRSDVASLLGCDPSQVLFTSGGTESNNLALSKLLDPNRSTCLVTSEVEHSSIGAAANHLEGKGSKVIRLPVDSSGRVSLDEMSAALQKEAVDLVSIQWANSETGVLQPISKISSLCRRFDVPLHVDACQIVGKAPIDLKGLAIDLFSLSGHKFHCPPGIGALFFENKTLVTRLIHGGDQEFGLRAGTENLPGIAALGKAAALKKQGLERDVTRMESLRDYFEQRLHEAIPDIHINGVVAQRVCNASNVLFPGIDGGALVAQLDAREIRCSQTSACTSARPEPSSVLKAMGLSEEQAYSSVRFAFSVLNSTNQVDQAVEAISDVYSHLRSFSSLLRA